MISGFFEARADRAGSLYSGLALGLVTALLALSPVGGTQAQAIDTDSDGILDDADNCRTVANANQRDRNRDGFGDACVQSRIGKRVTVGADPIIGKGVNLRVGVTLGDNVVIGDRVSIARDVAIGDDVALASRITIGRGSTIGAGSTVGSNTRIARDVEIEPAVRIGQACPPRGRKLCVRIGNGSLIREGAVIENDVTLRRNVDVGAGATVTAGSNLPNGTIVPPELDDPAVLAINGSEPSFIGMINVGGQLVAVRTVTNLGGETATDIAIGGLSGEWSIGNVTFGSTLAPGESGDIFVVYVATAPSTLSEDTLEITYNNGAGVEVVTRTLQATAN